MSPDEARPSPTAALTDALRGSGAAAEAILAEIDERAAAIDRASLAVSAYVTVYLLAAGAALAFVLADVPWLAERAYVVAGGLEAIPALALVGRLAASRLRPAGRPPAEARALERMYLHHLVGGLIGFVAFELAFGEVAEWLYAYVWFTLFPLATSVTRWVGQAEAEVAFYVHDLLARLVPAALPGATFEPLEPLPDEAFADSWFLEGRAPRPSRGRIAAEVGGRSVVAWLVDASEKGGRHGCCAVGLFVAARVAGAPVPGRVLVMRRPPGPALLHREFFGPDDQRDVRWEAPAFFARFAVKAPDLGVARAVLTPERRHALLTADAATPEPLLATWSGDMVYLWFEGPGRAIYRGSWRRPDRASLARELRLLRVGFALAAYLAASERAADVP